jgi:DNA-binding transcriptional ArsR family regulator
VDQWATVHKPMLDARVPARILNALVNNKERLTSIFAALADPTRRRILLELSNGAERPVTTLARPFRVSPPAISRHLRVLEKARLIARRRRGRIHLIRARPDGLNDAQKWLEECAAAWTFSFDNLGRLLTDEQSKPSINSARF